jgi:hypothetical protein
MTNDPENGGPNPKTQAYKTTTLQITTILGRIGWTRLPIQAPKELQRITPHWWFGESIRLGAYEECRNHFKIDWKLLQEKNGKPAVLRTF